MKTIPASRYWCFGILATMGLAWDLISKSWVFASLGYPYHESEWNFKRPFLWGELKIHLTTSFNQGALWGVGQGYSWLFAALSVVAAIFVFYWLFYRGEAQSWWFTISLALILAGTLGNLYDRLYLHGCFADGHPMYGVRDFLKFDIPLIGYRWPFHFFLIPVYEWPIFNFADTYLVTGAILLTVQSFRAPAHEEETQPNPSHSALPSGPGPAVSVPMTGDSLPTPR